MGHDCTFILLLQCFKLEKKLLFGGRGEVPCLLVFAADGRPGGDGRAVDAVAVAPHSRYVCVTSCAL